MGLGKKKKGDQHTKKKLFKPLLSITMSKTAKPIILYTTILNYLKFKHKTEKQENQNTISG